MERETLNFFLTNKKKHQNMNKAIHNKKTNINGNSLLNYLNDELTPAETRALEKMFVEDEMLVDAIEGLRMLDSSTASTIDLKIKQLINKKIAKKRKEFEFFSFPTWLFISIILILLLVSIGYFIIYTLTR